MMTAKTGMPETDPEFAGEEIEDIFHPTPSAMERGCMLICEIGIVVMALIVLVEIMTRNLFGFSYEISEELGGYIICGITFLSLPVCQVYRSYHHVQLIQQRLSPRWRAISHLLFDVVNLALCGVLVWQLARLTMLSYRSGDVAPSLLATPLWIPQAVMPIGAVAVTISLLRSAAGNLRRVMATKG
jgi:TRAP-type C4-dicarboxylate transport system permease small subunit